MDRYTQKESYTHAGWSLERRRKHLYDTILREHRSILSGVILMLGCNSCSTLQLVQEHAAQGSTVVGLDLNLKALREGIGFRICANVLCLPIGFGTVSCILALDIIEHIYPDDMAELVHEFYRILVDGGRVLAFSPRCDERNPSQSAMDPAHVQWFSTTGAFYRDWRRLFRVEELQYDTRENPGIPGKHDAILMQLCKTT